MPSPVSSHGWDGDTHACADGADPLCACTDGPPHESHMNTIGLNYDVKPEHVEDFKEYTQRVIEVMKGFDGHVETRLYTDAFKPTSMMIYSEWENVALFRVFMGSDDFKNTLKNASGMLSGRPSHKIFQRAGDL